jgi:hypothetical protein
LLTPLFIPDLGCTRPDRLAVFWVRGGATQFPRAAATGLFCAALAGSQKQFSTLVKGPKICNLKSLDSVTDYVGWGDAGGAPSASGIGANPKLKHRAGADWYQRLESWRGSVLARLGSCQMW